MEPALKAVQRPLSNTQLVRHQSHHSVPRVPCSEAALDVNHNCLNTLREWCVSNTIGLTDGVFSQ